MLQIKSHAEQLGPGREDWGDRFPSHDHNSRDDRVLEEKAEREKHGAIAETSECRHQEVGSQLAEARSIKDVRFGRGTKAAVHQAEASKDGCLEECDGDDRAGKKLSYYQDFSLYRDEKLIMESAFDHFAAK